MEICSCGGKMKVCQQNKVKGSECTCCGRRIWNSKDDEIKSRIDLTDRINSQDTIDHFANAGKTISMNENHV